MPRKSKRSKVEEDSDYELTPPSSAKKSKGSFSRSVSVQPPPPQIQAAKNAERDIKKNTEKDIKKTAAKEAVPKGSAAVKKENQRKNADPKSKNPPNHSAQEFVEIKDEDGKDLARRNGLAESFQTPETPIDTRTVVLKALFPANNDFPADPNGDVYIQLGVGVSRSVFKLHSDVLCRNSDWFTKSLQSKMPEIDDEIAARGMAKLEIWHRFGLVMDDPKRDLWVLRKTSFTKYKPQVPVKAPNLPPTRGERAGSEVQFLTANCPPAATQMRRNRQNEFREDGPMDIDPPNENQQPCNDQPKKNFDITPTSSPKENASSTNLVNQPENSEPKLPADFVQRDPATLEQAPPHSQNASLDNKTEEIAEAEVKNVATTRQSIYPLSQSSMLPLNEGRCFDFNERLSFKEPPTTATETGDESSASPNFNHQAFAARDSAYSEGKTNDSTASGHPNGDNTSSSYIDPQPMDEDQKHNDRSSMDPESMAALQAFIYPNGAQDMDMHTIVNETATAVLHTPTNEKFEDSVKTSPKYMAESEANVVKSESAIEQEKEFAVESNAQGPKENELVPSTEIETTEVKDEQQEPGAQPSSAAKPEVKPEVEPNVEPNVEPKIESKVEHLLDQQPEEVPKVENPKVKEPLMKALVSTKKAASKPQSKQANTSAKEPETITIDDSQTTDKPKTKKATTPKKNYAAKQKEVIEPTDPHEQTTRELNTTRAAPKKPAHRKPSTKVAPKSDPIVKEEEDDTTDLASVPISPPNKIILNVSKPLKSDKKDENIFEEGNDEPEITMVMSKSKEMTLVPPQPPQPIPSSLTINGFTNLFRVYYDKDIVISTDNFGFAQTQAELLTHFLTFYGVKSPEKLKKVNRFLCEKLEIYGPKLYDSIKCDPPRWMYHSLFLQSGVIFKEAIIHMVGMYPNFPWKSIPENFFTPSILILIRQKAEDLQILAAKVDIHLHELTVNHYGVSVLNPGLPKSMKREAARIWHEWHTDQILEACYTRTKTTDNSIAVRYRTMGQGVHGYLQEDKEWNKIVDAWDNDLTKLEESHFKNTLSAMKWNAHKCVQPLMRNESRLNPNQNQMQYLTCTKIEDHELPWVQDPEMRELDEDWTKN